MANLNSKGPPDVSILKPGMQTSVTGLRQALIALESATLEVKRYMLDEASIIYECKTCNNMFRSLAHLIAHKRSYCSNRYAEVKHIYTDKIGKDFAASQMVYIENESIETVVPEENFQLDCYAPGLDLLKEANILQEIRSEPLVSSLLPPKRKGLQNVVERLHSRLEPSEQSGFLFFEPMQENGAAIFQTLGQFSSIGREFRDIHEDKSRTVVVAPSGLELPKGRLPRYEPPSSPCSSDNSKENNQHETKKRWRYFCPFCKTVSLAKMTNMYRHIEQKHGKSREEARRLRKKIKTSGKLMDIGRVIDKDYSTSKRYGGEDRSSGAGQWVAKRVKSESQALQLAQTLGLVNENGIGVQKLHKEAEVTDKTENTKKSRRERRLARSGEDNWNSTEEDEDNEVSFNLDRISPQQMSEPRKKVKVKLSVSGSSSSQGYLSGDFKCELCSKEFKTPTFLMQHQSGSHFRTQILTDFAADFQKKKCSLCGATFEGTRLLVHIGATHKICLRYLSDTDAAPAKPVSVVNTAAASPATTLGKPAANPSQSELDNVTSHDKSTNSAEAPAKKGGKSRGETPPMPMLVPLLEDAIMQ